MLIGNKNIKTSIYIIQANDSIIREYSWIGIYDFILKDKSLLNHITLFSPK